MATEYVAVFCGKCRTYVTVKFDGDRASCADCKNRSLEMNKLLCHPAYYKGGAQVYMIQSIDPPVGGEEDEG